MQIIELMIKDNSKCNRGYVFYDKLNDTFTTFLVQIVNNLILY